MIDFVWIQAHPFLSVIIMIIVSETIIRIANGRR